LMRAFLSALTLLKSFPGKGRCYGLPGSRNPLPSASYILYDYTI
jgi:hypothetical protein